MEIFDFKCKYCGGELHEVYGQELVAKCQYCGTKQTLPKLYSEKRANFFSRANHLRRNNEFDRAEALYEQILNEDPTDPEAYWLLVLCRFGIEYVEDVWTKELKPTVNRTQLTSIFADEDYKSAIKYANYEQRELYRQEAEAINEIQKGILEISQKEAPFDVFICYKETDENGRRSKDSVLAHDLYRELIRDGYKVFFARETLSDKIGTAYEPYIFSALNSSKVMVVLGTKREHFEAVWVRNEWSRFLGQIKNGERKTLIPVYKDMDAYLLPPEFANLQALNMDRIGYLQELISGVENIVRISRKRDSYAREDAKYGANIPLKQEEPFKIEQPPIPQMAEETQKSELPKEPEVPNTAESKEPPKEKERKKKEKKKRTNPLIIITVILIIVAIIGTAAYIVLSVYDVIISFTSPDSSADFLYSENLDGTISITGYDGFLKQLSIPPSINGKTVTSISFSAFKNLTTLQSITIPGTVNSIGPSAFSNCSSLNQVILENGITSIGDNAFSGCSRLTAITIPNSIITIGEAAFYNCKNLAQVNLGRGLTLIEDKAFSGCDQLTNIIYAGTMESWEAISRPSSWAPVNSRTVRCTDGKTSV